MKFNNPIFLRYNNLNNIINNNFNYYRNNKHTNFILYYIHLNKYFNNEIIIKYFNNLFNIEWYFLNKIYNLKIYFINYIYLINIFYFYNNFNFNFKLFKLKILNLPYIFNIIKYNLKKNLSIKKIIKNLYMVLNTNKYIKGFKIIIKGRFKNSIKKSKKIFYYGNINSQKLVSNIKQYNSQFNSKYGMIGIRLLISYI